MGTRSSKSSTVVTSTTIDEFAKKVVLLLGASDQGKSTFFNALKRCFPEDGDDKTFCDPIVFEKELQLACACVLHRFWMLSKREPERAQWTESIPDEIKTKLDIRPTVPKDLIEELNCCEYLLKLWMVPDFRKYYQSMWNSDFFSMYENVEELISNMETKKKFHPLSLYLQQSFGQPPVFIPTIKGSSSELEFLDFGGRRSERKKHMFYTPNIVIYFASLSEFNQVAFEDCITPRMNESILLASDIFESRFFSNCRKILIFTKPDSLIKKLQRGVQYNRQLNDKMRPELEDIVDKCGSRKVMNSIISEYLEKISPESFHIVNVTLDEEVKCVCELLFGEKSSQYTTNTFISKCLFPMNTQLQLKLFNNYSKGNKTLTDIQILCENNSN